MGDDVSFDWFARGVHRAWADRDYRTIVCLADRLPSSVLQEDAGLLIADAL